MYVSQSHSSHTHSKYNTTHYSITSKRARGAGAGNIDMDPPNLTHLLKIGWLDIDRRILYGGLRSYTELCGVGYEGNRIKLQFQALG